MNRDKKKQFDTAVFIERAQAGDNIYQIARRLGCTVSELSFAIGRICKKSKIVAEKLEKYKFPINVSSGYIFVGHHFQTTSERDSPLLLYPGAYVLAEKLQRKRDKWGSKNIFYDLLKPVREIQYEFKLIIATPNPLTGGYKASVVKKSIWVRQKDLRRNGKRDCAIECLRKLKIRLKDGQKGLLISKDKTRIIYRRGKYLDTVPAAAVVSVTSDFK
jgi:hypothetical protein